NQSVGGPRPWTASREPPRLLPSPRRDRGLRAHALDDDSQQRSLGRRLTDVRPTHAVAGRAPRHREHPPPPLGDAVRRLARLPTHSGRLGPGGPGGLGLRPLHLHPGHRCVPRVLATRRREPVGATTRRYAPWAALALLAALLRLPFLGSIGPDEGGYAYVAWRWSRGADLYRSVWIDRPQGLILVYRVLISMSHSAWAIRLGAIVAGAAVTVLLAAIGRLLAGPAPGFLAGSLYAIAGIGPHIEGYPFNGELAASVPSTAAVAAGPLPLRRRSRALRVVAAAPGGPAGPLE